MEWNSYCPLIAPRDRVANFHLAVSISLQFRTPFRAIDRYLQNRLVPLLTEKTWLPMHR